jgi:hypothetical protein
MKKCLVLFMVLSLMFLVTGSVSAAVHNFTGDFINPFLMDDFSGPSFEGWYSIEKDSPSVTTRGLFPENYDLYGFEYFQNDQTFANLTYFSPDNGDSETYLKGSYLFENNFFVGLDYGTDGDVSHSTLSPGYRFNFGDDGYMAVSLDYAADDDYLLYVDKGIIDYEITAKYYTDLSRIYGQIVIPNEDVVVTDKTFFYVGGAYKLSDNVVLGANFTNGPKLVLYPYYGLVWTDCTTYDLGATATFDKLGVELKYEVTSYDDLNDETNATSLNALYSFTDNIRAGLQATKQENVDDPDLYAKIKYTVDDTNSIILIHKFANDSIADDDGVTYLRWDIALQ